MANVYTSAARQGHRLVLPGLVIALLAAAGPSWAQNAIEVHYTDLWSRGEYHAALKALEAYVQDAPRDRHFRHLAQLYFETGQVDKAIQTMERVAEMSPESSTMLELALMYKYVGQMDLYRTRLDHSARLAQSSRYLRRRDENLVAMGRIAELLGENPRTILNTHYKMVIETQPNLVIARIAAGDLAFRKAAYDLSAGYYQDALKLEPDNQEALAGLAETYWKSSDPRLEETLTALLAKNPNHPRARAIQVEKLLDEGKGREALSLIEKAFEINPVDTRFRSLQAAAYFLEDDIENMRRVHEEVLAFNPWCSEVYRTTGRVASRHYRFKEAAELQAKAIALDPADHEARALYTLDLMRLGRESEGRAELEAAFAADPFNIQLSNLIDLMDTLGTFKVIERGPFILKLPEHEAPLVAEDSLELLEEAVAQFTAKYDVELETPILVEMFDQHDDFMVRSVGLPGNVGHLGICFGSVVTMDSPSARPRGSWNWRSVLWHEFMHVITLQKTNNRMPRWLSEGISVHEEGQYSPAWKSKLDADHRLILKEDGLPSVRELDGYFTGAKSAAHLMFGYFAAGEFVDFYIDRYTYTAMNAALDDIAGGTDALDALSRAAGVSVRELDAGFEEYLTERIKPFEQLPELQAEPNLVAGRPGSFFQPRTAPPGAAPEAPSSPYTDLLKEGAQAEQAEAWAKAETAYRKAHALYPDNASGDAPLRRLAALYDRVNNEAKLRETLEEILYWTPAELPAAKKLVEMYTEREEWQDLTRVADWAVGIDPYDVDLQRALAEGYVRLGARPDAIDTLAVLAHIDSGRAMVHRLQSAELMVEEGALGDSKQLAEAKRQVLLVLEEAPNFWDAQELLLKIVDGGNAAGAGSATTRDSETTGDSTATTKPITTSGSESTSGSVSTSADQTAESISLSTAIPHTRGTAARAARALAFVAAGSALWAETAAAQSWGYRGPRYEMPQRDIFPGDKFTFCRIRYTSMGGYGRGDWQTDFPASDLNFSQRLEELTTITVNKDERGNYKHVVMDITDEQLFDYPFIYMIEVGRLHFTDQEVETLRDYLLRGGFLMVDDFWGTMEWENWEYEISRVFDPREYPMKKLDLEHPIFHMVFTLKEIPQVPSIHHWLRGGNTSERGRDSEEPRYLGISDKEGRLMVLICHNTDLGDGWEREGENRDYFEVISSRWAYPLGINIVVYAMTH